MKTSQTSGISPPHFQPMRTSFNKFVHFSLLCAVAISTQAAVIPVNTTAEDGPDSLREALTFANHGDTILLPPNGVFQMATIFNDAANFIGPTATPMISSSITIEGRGSRFEHSGNLN